MGLRNEGLVENGSNKIKMNENADGLQESGRFEKLFATLLSES